MRQLMMAALLLAGFAFAAPVKAEDQADTVAAAREMIAVMHVTDTMKKLFPTMMQQIRHLVVDEDPDSAEDFDRLTARMEIEFVKHVDELSEEIAVIYSKTFTQAEIRDITAFYRSQTGAKMVGLQAELTQATMLVSSQWGRRVTSKILDEMKTELRKEGHAI